ncbi:hypothetical protein RIF29_25297 [Crotalaria pallida]|uniref:Secreted protein n=1 Tax=Crotalaria pallida TaxID=3830 RepID=A0AAN9EM64_CROPI
MVWIIFYVICIFQGPFIAAAAVVTHDGVNSVPLLLFISETKTLLCAVITAEWYLESPFECVDFAANYLPL